MQPEQLNATREEIHYDKMRGRIRKLKEGYGFISGDDGLDYFFHWSAMQKTSKDFRELELRERVEFIPIEADRDRKRAIEIRILAEEN